MKLEKSEHAILTNIDEEDERIIQELTKGEAVSEFMALGHLIHRAFEFNMTNNKNRLVKLDIGAQNGKHRTQNNAVNIQILYVTDEELIAYRQYVENNTSERERATRWW